MWQIFQHELDADSTFSSSAITLMQSTARNVMVTIGIIFALWHIIATATWVRELREESWLLVAFVLPVFFMSLRLLPRHYLLAQALWYSGLLSAVTLAFALFQRPEITFLYMLIPFMVSVTIGWRAGLLVFGAIVGLLSLALLGWMLPPLPGFYAALIMLVGAIFTLVGWTSTYALATVTGWSATSLTDSQRHLHLAQEQRAQLAMTLKDLDHAYYRLERANVSLVVARQAAEDAERSKTELITYISHELRTPLNLISGYSEVMISSPESYGGVQLPPAYRGDLDAIYQSSEHILAIADDILDMARIDTRRLTLRPELTSLRSLAQEAADTVRDYITTKQLELRVLVPDELPLVSLDQLRIRQVLLNLLVNAARFTRQGSITLAITCREDELYVSVQDTGEGIEKENLLRVFEEFHTSEQVQHERHGGSGLGLSISKKFIELHGGQIGVNSLPGKGSTFWFTLPAQLRDNLDASHSARRWQPRVTLQATERILIVVHDDLSIARLLEGALPGYSVVTVTSATEGRQRAQELHAIALLIGADVPLPPQPFTVPVITCPLPSRLKIAQKLGADDFLPKPLAQPVLLAAIQRLQRPISRVLVVDDDSAITRLFQRMLTPTFNAVNCIAVHNGADALTLLHRERFDLVLLDMNMPELDGQTILAQLRTDPHLHDLAVMLVSGELLDQVTLVEHDQLRVTWPVGARLGDLMQSLDAVLKVLSAGWSRLEHTPQASGAGSNGQQAFADMPLPPTP